MFDQELAELMRQKDKLYKKYIIKQSSYHKALYNKARNTYYHLLKKKKVSFNASVFENIRMI